jgi:hypothetical protein
MAKKNDNDNAEVPNTIILFSPGRPKEDLSSLPEGWEGQLINMYSSGAADVEVMAWIAMVRGSFSRDLWRRWLNEESVFSDIIEMGRMLSEAWWSKLGRENVKNNQFNSIMFIWRTRNQFGWNDKGEVKTIETPISEIDYTKISTESLRELASAIKNKKHENS